MKKIKIMITLVGCMLIVFCCYYMNYPFFVYGNEDFGIDDYTSEIDLDKDGIDDQLDILLGAKDYLASKPSYKSCYYATGYPNDGYGVCSDVVARALLQAGYDLRELVNQDILENRKEYDVDVVDKNIDFRRVRNLDVYFKNTAKTLTIDIEDIEEWQAGDIVVFEHHIGIISESRNEQGVPYVLHHGRVMQLFYEEDILEKRSDEIIGHYRIS